MYTKLTYSYTYPLFYDGVCIKCRFLNFSLLLPQKALYYYCIFTELFFRGNEDLKLLEERIIADGKVIGDDILKVDMFLNHQIDVHLLQEIGKEFKRRFDGCNINKILTIEASGIGIACITAQYFSVPVVFAKKGAHKNVGSNVYSSVVHSFTKGTDSLVTVSKDYINKGDKILIIDDFLANGAAVSGLIDIINQAGAELEGVGIAIEKGFQPGRKVLEEKGARVESLAIIEKMGNGTITFKEQDD